MKYFFAVLLVASAFDLDAVRESSSSAARRNLGARIFEPKMKAACKRGRCPDAEYFGERMGWVSQDLRKMYELMERRDDATDYNRNEIGRLKNAVDDVSEEVDVIDETAGVLKAQVRSLQEENQLLKANIEELRSAMRLMTNFLKLGKRGASRRELNNLKKMLGCESDAQKKGKATSSTVSRPIKQEVLDASVE